MSLDQSQKDAGVLTFQPYARVETERQWCGRRLLTSLNLQRKITDMLTTVCVRGECRREKLLHKAEDSRQLAQSSLSLKFSNDQLDSADLLQYSWSLTGVCSSRTLTESIIYHTDCSSSVDHTMSKILQS